MKASELTQAGLENLLKLYSLREIGKMCGLSYEGVRLYCEKFGMNNPRNKKYLRSKWPSKEEFISLLRKYTTKELAEKLGVEVHSIYNMARCYDIRIRNVKPKYSCRCNISIYDIHRDILAKLGNGNVSAGIRYLVDNWNDTHKENRDDSCS